MSIRELRFMKSAFVLAVVLASAAATGASAVSLQAAPAAATPVSSPEAIALARQIRSALATARADATAKGLSGQPLELAVSAAVESVIATSGANPATVLAAIQIAMADEKCMLTSPTDYNFPGCRALADIKAAVSSAIGGPAALGGTGAVASSGNGPPPTAATGADYGN